ncbi:MAG: polysaccharide biosynthesis C-terminal domain-containing protein, partial [Pirellulales bacterium]|nr:polysaccharide biosynthesis C-terminal domain-containing protein [Pirellulales bacterium]
LGFSIVLLATCVQGALISSPYTVFGNRMERNARAAYAGSALVHQWALSGLITSILTIAGIGIAFGSGSASFGIVEWILAVMLPFILIREFIRRVAFAHLRLRTVLALDVGVCLMQIGGLTALWASDSQTAGTAFGAIGVACGIAGGAAWFFMRSHFAPSRKNALADLRLNWSFGKWAFGAQVALLAAAYTVPWLLAFLMGTDDTGRFAACMSIVMVVNPILIGLNNFLGPQAIHVYQREGLSALRRLTWRFSLVLFGLLGLVTLLLWFAGGDLLVRIYGQKFSGNQLVVAILAINILASALGMGMESGLTALQRPDFVFWSQLSGLAVTLTAAVPWILQQGVVGAAWAVVAGTITTTVAKIGLFTYAFRKYQISDCFDARTERCVQPR